MKRGSSRTEEINNEKKIVSSLFLSLFFSFVISQFRLRISICAGENYRIEVSLSTNTRIIETLPNTGEEREKEREKKKSQETKSVTRRLILSGRGRPACRQDRSTCRHQGGVRTGRHEGRVRRTCLLSGGHLRRPLRLHALGHLRQRARIRARIRPRIQRSRIRIRTRLRIRTRARLRTRPLRILRALRRRRATRPLRRRDPSPYFLTAPPRRAPVRRGRSRDCRITVVSCVHDVLNINFRILPSTVAFFFFNDARPPLPVYLGDLRPYMRVIASTGARPEKNDILEF